MKEIVREFGRTLLAVIAAGSMLAFLIRFPMEEIREGIFAADTLPLTRQTENSGFDSYMAQNPGSVEVLKTSLPVNEEIPVSECLASEAGAVTIEKLTDQEGSEIPLRDHSGNSCFYFEEPGIYICLVRTGTVGGRQRIHRLVLLANIEYKSSGKD